MAKHGASIACEVLCFGDKIIQRGLLEHRPVRLVLRDTAGLVTLFRTFSAVIGQRIAQPGAGLLAGHGGENEKSSSPGVCVRQIRQTPKRATAPAPDELLRAHIEARA